MFLKNDKWLYRFIGWFYLCNAVIFLVLGYGFLKAIFLSGSLFENSIVNFTSGFFKTYIVIYAIINYISYITALAFIPACLMWVFAAFLPYRKLIVSLCILTASACAIVLVVDSQIYSMFKFHLNIIILNMFFSEQSLELFDFSKLELLEFGLGIGFFILLEMILAWMVWHKIILKKRFLVGQSIALFWLGGFLFSYFSLLITITNGNNLLSQQNPNLPFFNQLIAYLIPAKNADDILMRYSEDHFSQFTFTNAPLNYPLHPLTCDIKIKPYNIIVILVDSLRFDSLNTKFMPKLTEFSKENWRFFSHYSGGNATQPGLFSLFYSIPSSYWTSALEQKKRPVFFDVLDQNNYKTRVIWSSGIKNPPFDKTIYLDVKNLSDDTDSTSDIGTRDKEITELAIDYLKKNTGDKPIYLNLFYNAPHGFCSDQTYPEIYPATKSCSRLMMSNDMDATPYYNRYLNSVHFVDNEIARLLETIESEGYLKNSIIIISSDHAQEFNDNKKNYWGHAGNFTKFQIKIPLIIHWPNQSAKKITYRTTSYDIIPTLLQNVFHCTNPASDYSIGQNLLKETGRPNFLITGSYANMGVVESDRITTLNASGQIRTTDLNASPILNTQPRMDVFKKALMVMHQYYMNKKKNE